MEIVNKPWGCEHIISITPTYVVKEIRVAKGAALSLQYHKNKVETMFLVDGEGYLGSDTVGHASNISTSVEWTPSKICGWSVKMEKLRPYYIQPGTHHRLFTIDSHCVVVEVSSIELEDVVRISDSYGRC